MKRYSLYISAVLLSACGGGSNTPMMTPSAPGTGNGQVALKISGAKSFNPSITPGKINQYVITVSGDGFDPIQTVVDGDASHATITGVPVGEHRSVHVAAYNPNNQMIREGEASDVMVPPDAVADAAVTMQAVPVISNVADGAYVPNTRLRFSIYSDPATVVELKSDRGGDAIALTDVTENRSQVATHADTGLALFNPGVLSPGDYTLTVNDAATGRHSQTHITITDGHKERGAPLVSGALTAASVGSVGITPVQFITRTE